jgi:hypothetical protein
MFLTRYAAETAREASDTTLAHGVGRCEGIEELLERGLKPGDYVLAITAVANLVVAGFSPRSIHSHLLSRGVRAVQKQPRRGDTKTFCAKPLKRDDPFNLAS